MESKYKIHANIELVHSIKLKCDTYLIDRHTTYSIHLGAYRSYSFFLKKIHKISYR